MPTFDNLDSLLAHVQKQIDDTMVDEVADAVVDTMKAEIQNTVYGVYQPHVYNRRFDNGGLLDENNIKVTPVKNEIEVKNVTPVNTAYGYSGSSSDLLDEIIVSGSGYTYDNGGAYLKPRDFYAETIMDLKLKGNHTTALKKGLKKRGIDTK